MINKDHSEYKTFQEVRPSIFFLPFFLLPRKEVSLFNLASV